MSIALQIRPAQLEDAETIYQFISDLAEYEKLSHMLELNVEMIKKEIFGAKPTAEVVIAEIIDEKQQKHTAGFALFFHNFSTFLCKRGLYLEDLYVKPQWRSHGVGKALLSHLASVAIERQCGRFEWCVLDWNEPAINFYKSQGAKVMEDWRICRVEGEAIKELANASSLS